MKVAFLLSLVSLLIAGCKKDTTEEPPPAVNNAPLVNAGNDTTIYFPVSSIDLLGIASDPDFDAIVDYDWQIFSGPDEVLMNPLEVPNTTVMGMNVPGVYEFQFTVKDSRKAKSHDMIKVTLADRPCNSETNEKVLENQEWAPHEYWSDPVLYVDLYSHLPPKGNFRQLYIKTASSTEWVLVPAFGYELPRPHQYYYQYFNGIAVVFPIEGAVVGDGFDLKIVYCN